MPILDALTKYSTPPTNYIGTAVFLAYIAVAIAASSAITVALRRAYARLPPSSPAADRARTFSLLALLSFGVLSGNMVDVLVQSYPGKYAGERSLVGEWGALGERVWRWMVESSLFVDFAGDLVANEAAALAAQLSLLETWKVAMAVGTSGREWGVGSFAAYLAVLQILPSSFVLSLLCVGLALNGAAETKEKRIALRSSARETVRASLCLVPYVATLAFLPAAGNMGSLVPAIFLLRFLLFTPIFFPGEKPSFGIAQIITSGSTVVLFGLALTRLNSGILEDALGLWKNPAVRTLLCDFGVQMLLEKYMTRLLQLKLDVRGFISENHPQSTG